MSTYAEYVRLKHTTPQTSPIPGSTQMPNDAGGHSWAVDDWVRLERFLILGSESPTYYATAPTLTRENATAVERCLAADGARTVATIVAVSQGGRAPKNDPAIFALALAATLGDAPTKRAALAAVPAVCRIGTHLFHFAAFVDAQRGWGRGLRRAIGGWYGQDPARLAYQAIKYQQRDGWSHRDLLRLAHPHAPTEQHQALYHYLVKGWPDVGVDPHPDPVLVQVWAAERAKVVTTAPEIVRLITDYDLPREAVPTAWLTDATVWAALLARMPLEALVRNLATLTRVGVVTPGSVGTGQVVAALADGARIQAARLHPIKVLAALKTYAAGRGVRGSHTWAAVPTVIDALDGAFYRAFAAVPPTGLRYCLALDVSGSMASGDVGGVLGLSPREASAALALVTLATEPVVHPMAFSTTFTPLALSARQRLDDVMRVTAGFPFAGTDCSLPMRWALEARVPIDMFVVYTDSETWAGPIHPAQALRAYRQALGIPARLAVVGLDSNGFSIADPDDAGMLDFVGFDTALPTVLADFASGGRVRRAPDESN